MNDHTIALVRESFDLIEPIAPQVGEMFYANLFDAEPSLQRLSTSDIAAQGAELMQRVALAVARLDQPDLLQPVLQQIARRHTALDLRPAHEAVLLAALLKSLYQGLGAAYNAEVEEAWVEVFVALAARVRALPVVPA